MSFPGVCSGLVFNLFGMIVDHTFRGVGAVIFTPSSGEINYLGVGGQHRGCGAAAALVRFAEEAMQVADLFIAALAASVALGFSWVPSTPGPQTPDRRWHSRTAQAPE